MKRHQFRLVLKRHQFRFQNHGATPISVGSEATPISVPKSWSDTNFGWENEPIPILARHQFSPRLRPAKKELTPILARQFSPRLRPAKKELTPILCRLRPAKKELTPILCPGRCGPQPGWVWSRRSGRRVVPPRSPRSVRSVPDTFSPPILAPPSAREKRVDTNSLPPSAREKRVDTNSLPWQVRTAARLGLESTFRPQGRPPKKPKERQIGS